MFVKSRTLKLAAGALTAAGLATFVPTVARADESPSPSPSTTTTAPSDLAQACDAGPWGSRVQGAPANFDGGDRGGDYLWHDGSGFHLRVTHRNDNRVVYTGQIVSPEPMRIDPVKLEPGDSATLSPDHRTITFVFVDHGHVDGVDFHTDCASHLTLTNLNAGDEKLSANRVYLGAREVHPARIPFTIHRSDDTDR